MKSLLHIHTYIHTYIQPPKDNSNHAGSGGFMKGLLKLVEGGLDKEPWAYIHTYTHTYIHTYIQPPKDNSSNAASGGFMKGLLKLVEGGLDKEPWELVFRVPQARISQGAAGADDMRVR